MRISFTFARKSYFRFYRKFVLCLYALNFALLALFFTGMLGECRFNGTAMESCTFAGMNVNALADNFIAIWMIPIIGIFLGLLAPWIAAITPSFILWIVLFGIKMFKIQDMPEEEAIKHLSPADRKIAFPKPDFAGKREPDDFSAPR